ncbi:MAG TPA: flagellar basal body L-ring protein FlgH [Clostridia bacterium]|nr:flagellar basal body L-ring protein FlgH [Clostridia bacterium]
MNMRVAATAAMLGVLVTVSVAKSKRADSRADYIARLHRDIGADTGERSPGSVWAFDGRFADLASDNTARAVHDVVFVDIVEQTVAEASGNVASERSSSASSGISALAGRLNTGGIEQLFSPRSERKLKGQAQTQSSSRLRTTLAGEVVAVLPNGTLVVEARREVTVNHERQTVLLRGVARPSDLTPDNRIASTALSHLELELKGKGVISDSTRPPNWIVRTLLRLVGF